MKLFDYDFFLEHPTNVCMSYFNHFKFSSNLSVKLFFGSVKALIHAIFPEYFKSSTSDLIDEIQLELKESGCKGRVRNRIRTKSFE